MKRYKQIISVIGMALITVGTSCALYGYVMKNEEKRSWQELQTTAQSVKEAFEMKVNDELAKLHLVKTIMIGNDLLTVENIDFLYLDKVQPNTIFSRIDILYPDDTLISNGKEVLLNENIRFQKLKVPEEKITSRKKDFLTGNPSVYYLIPVKEREEVAAMIVGVIDAKELAEIFQPIIYEGQANICIIDSEDGNYIMDSWHKELGNAYEMPDRKRMRGYETVDLKQEIKNLESGTIAFQSETRGENLYLYYTPMGLFQWELAIFATEDQLFSNLVLLRKVFVWAGLLEAVMLVAYCGWNIHIVKQLQTANTEKEAQKKKLEYLSHRDVLTSLYNRYQYTEVLAALDQKPLQNVGVAYIDLNGLKQINDQKYHEAGDQYICMAAGLLSEIFGENCYRIGGDEFVVLMIGVEKERFEEHAERLKKYAEEKAVSISVGTLWRENCSALNELLWEAEKKMYVEKQKYYEVHDRRRKRKNEDAE